MKRIYRDVVAAILAHETLSAWLFFSFLLTLTGPFGTYETMSAGQRLIYWPGLSAVSVVIGYCILHGYANLLAGFPVYLAMAVRIATFTLIFSPILHFATLAIVPDEPLREKSPFLILGLVAAISTAVDLARQQFGRIMAHRREVNRPRLFRRIPDVKTADVVRMTVLDHYVIVYIADGSSHRLLMRFSDAVHELEGLEGHCTHRSHWVVDAYVAGALRRDTREVLVLTTGDEVPIGRKYRPGLVSAGLIRDPHPKPSLGQGDGKASTSREDGKGSTIQ